MQTTRALSRRMGLRGRPAFPRRIPYEIPFDRSGVCRVVGCFHVGSGGWMPEGRGGGWGGRARRRPSWRGRCGGGMCDRPSPCGEEGERGERGGCGVSVTRRDERPQPAAARPFPPDGRRGKPDGAPRPLRRTARDRRRIGGVRCDPRAERERLGRLLAAVKHDDERAMARRAARTIQRAGDVIDETAGCRQRREKRAGPYAVIGQRGPLAGGGLRTRRRRASHGLSLERRSERIRSRPETHRLSRQDQ